MSGWWPDVDRDPDLDDPYDDEDPAVVRERMAAEWYRTHQPEADEFPSSYPGRGHPPMVKTQGEVVPQP